MIQLYKEIKERMRTVKKISSFKSKLAKIKLAAEYEESKKETMGYYKTVL